MEELSMARDILGIIRGHVSPGTEVDVVRVQVGALSGVTPEDLTYSFATLAANTPYKGVRLEITPVPAEGCCNRCGKTSAMDTAEIACPSCKSPDVTIVAGRELRVSEIVGRTSLKGIS
jgi:hydrogenase nickel incorporation protein HypA/HybF